MLVATALVLLILVIFAQVFRAATGTIVTQRGLAQNDARARMLATLIRTDLQKCSYRDHTTSNVDGLIVVANGETPDSLQQGYVHISEGAVDNDVDDILQITTLVTNTSRSNDELPYIGKASRIGRPDGSGFSTDDKNQPDYDNGIAGDGALQSEAAEIIYFVRNGTLYRRVLPLRNQWRFPVAAGADPTMDPDGQGLELLPGDYDTANADETDTPQAYGDFWNDFDSSAYHDGTRVRFNGYRNPDGHLSGTAGGSLAIPNHRFGFRYDTGLPIEYVAGGFLGRFLHEETSHEEFGYPATTPPNASHPYIRNDLTFDARGVVTQYAGGPRVGEDILLPNVDGFDIKVWDPAAQDLLPTGAPDGYPETGAFVDLGYAVSGGTQKLASTAPGYFDHLHNYRKDFGGLTPGPGADGQPGDAGVDDDNNGTSDDESELGWPGSDDFINRVYDTWSVAADVADNYGADDFLSPYNAAGTNYFPAYRPLLSHGPDYAGPAPTYNKDYWTDTQAVVAGDMVFPLAWDTNTDGIIDPDEDIHQYAYRCITGGTTGATEPSWPTAPYGQTIIDGSAVWQLIDNRVGLTMIQITIRYRDIKSNLPRQVTIVHSFTKSE